MDNLRKLQLIELDILKEFIRICEKHNLRYYASDGTALGAARHKGFIPWDDDIDVTMPREDYEKLFDIARKHLKDGLEIESKSTGLTPFVQIINHKVVILGGYSKIAQETYAHIDVWPLDGLPNSRIKRYIRLKTSLIPKAFFYISIFKECIDIVRKRPFYQSVIIKFCNKVDFQRLFNKEKRFAAYDKIFRKYSLNKSNYCFAPWSTYLLKMVWKTEWFGEGVKLPFEDIEVIVPTHYDSYLRQIYGNYMEPPPENKRNQHGVTRILIKE